MNHMSWLDALGRGLVVPHFLDPTFFFTLVVNHLRKKWTGLYALFETTKVGRWTLSLGKRRRALSTVGAILLSGKEK